MYRAKITLVMGIILVGLAACQTVSLGTAATELSVMTYNIRLNIAVDGANAWPHRKEFWAAQVTTAAPDILGVQEAVPGQVDFIDAALPNHDYIGHGRNGGALGEYSAIYYHREKFTVEQEATFWLSQTPAIKSMGWDAAYPRICTYGLFTQQDTGKQFWIFNTHLDHVGEVARAKGTALILELIEQVNGQDHPVIFIGDFNAKPDDPLIGTIKVQMNDAKDISVSDPIGPDATFNGFKRNNPEARRIDYIFVSKSSSLSVQHYFVLEALQQGRYPSDHFPVMAVLAWD